MREAEPNLVSPDRHNYSGHFFLSFVFGSLCLSVMSMREADPNHPFSDMFFIVFNNQLYYFKKAKDFPVRVNEEAVFICYFRSNVTCNLHIFQYAG